MKQSILFSFMGGDRRMLWASAELKDAGYEAVPFPAPQCSHIVLPLPAFRGNAINQGPDFSQLLSHIHEGVTVLGGMMDTHKKELEDMGARIVDYYLHEPLIAANARLTAEAAIHLAASRLPITLENAQVLVCGWGRIGQLLAHKLKALGAQVTVSARNPKELGLMEAMGFTPSTTGQWIDLSSYTVIFNTVPAPVFTKDQMLSAPKECLFIDLASTPGFAFCPERSVITASGLPGAYAPETAGRLIGRAILQLCHLERR